MDKKVFDFLGLLKCALQGEKSQIDDNFDMEWAEQFAKKHRILPLLYYGAVKHGFSKQTEQMRRLFAETVQCAIFSAAQMKQIDKLCAAFDAAGVDYMPLKGVLLKPMYPAPEMRTMGDADILIRVEQYGSIKPIMLDLGYTEQLESDHELIWHKDNIHIELHKRLIPSYNKDYYAYFGDGWRLGKLKNGTRYAMTDEDQLIYLFTHYAKHYRDSGIGLNQILDLWVYKRNKPVLDEQYIQREMQMLCLDQFYKNTMDTLEVWFAEKPATPVTEMITSVIVNSGVYGTQETHILSDALKKAKKAGSGKHVRDKDFVHKLFLPYVYMREKYPVLQRLPVLLPVFWVIRIFRVLLFKRKEITAVSRAYNTAKEEKIDAYSEALRFVGLDFNIEE